MRTRNIGWKRATFLALVACWALACNTKSAPPETRQTEPASASSSASKSPSAVATPQKAPPVNAITIEPSAGPARHLLVLLHGVGDSAAGFRGVARELSRALPELAIVAPDGFHPFDGGGSGRQWFSRVGITEENRAERIRVAALEVSSFIDTELARRALPADSVLVGGFSQGAMVSGWLALHREPSPKAVVMLSGRINESPSWPTPRVSTPVFLGHGTEDAVVPFSFSAPAAKLLEERGAHVTQRAYPGMAHQISLEELSDVAAFLRSTLAS